MNKVWKIKPCPKCETARWITQNVDSETGVRVIECLVCGRRVEGHLWDIVSLWDKWRDDEQIEEV
nr:MAG TPA: DNA-directed RNA polymerase [Caudoviricetes sp.]